MHTITAELDFTDALIDQSRYSPGVERQHRAVGKALWQGRFANDGMDVVSDILSFPRNYPVAIDLLAQAMSCVGAYDHLIADYVQEAMWVACLEQSPITASVSFRIAADDEVLYAEDVECEIAGVAIDLDKLTDRDRREIEFAAERWVDQNYLEIKRRQREEHEEAVADHRYDEWKDRRIGL